MSSELFEVGLKTLKAILKTEDTSLWYKFKLKEDFFKGNEVDVFHSINHHLSKYSILPAYETIENNHLYLKPVKTVEPPEYYRDNLISRYSYEKMRSATSESQQVLAENKLDTAKAFAILQQAITDISDTNYNDRLFNFKTDGKQVMLNEYYNYEENKQHLFHWQYLDNMSNGVLGGDVISVVGRPAKGKTFLLIRIALENWRKKKTKPLIVSMEMNYKAVFKRLTAMYAEVNLTQLTSKTFATASETKFRDSLNALAGEETDLYIVDGNLTSTPEEIYSLAKSLGCDSVYIDGAYMLKSSNPRLDRYTRVAENVELIKKFTTELSIPTFCSWQLSRQGAKSKKAKGQKSELEDIGYSDAIGQISSIVLALEEEDTAETLNQRSVRLLKGRNGEVGEFNINWGFHNMDFSQVNSIEEGELVNL